MREEKNVKNTYNLKVVFRKEKLAKRGEKCDMFRWKTTIWGSLLRDIGSRLYALSAIYCSKENNSINSLVFL